MYIRNELFCFHLLGQFHCPLGDLLLAFFHPPRLPVFLLYFLWGENTCLFTLLLLAVRAYSLELQSLVLVMANFCLPAVRVRGLTLPEMARLKPQRPR